jgi:hypothetical protein
LEIDALVTVDEVHTFDTRGGNVRYVVRDSDGNEYTTFRESIGSRAQELEGSRARIVYDKLKPFKDRVAEDIKDREE